MLQYITWNINPEIFTIGPLSVRWYGLLWAVGIWLAFVITRRIYQKENLSDQLLDKLLVYIVVGTIVGARLGHCFFYEWYPLSEPVRFWGMTFSYGNEYFLKPWKLIAIWEGGLASHGGAIGILIAAYLYNKKELRKGFLWLLDRLIIGVAVCGAAIRFGNLMNSEIFGTPTTLPWGFEFVRSYEWEHLYAGQPCHPTQIYEMIYCLVTFAVCAFLYWKTKTAEKVGFIYGVFLLGIFGTRFILEFIKNDQQGFESAFFLNMGQLLSLPFVFWGFWCIASALFRNSKKKTA